MIGGLLFALLLAALCIVYIIASAEPEEELAPAPVPVRRDMPRRR